MSAAEAEASGLELFHLKYRVTLLLQKSTDVLLPLGLSWGVFGALWSTRTFVRGICLLLGVLSTVSIVFTYTRSMLLVAGLVVASLLLLALYRRQITRSIFVGFVVLMSLIVTILFFDLEAVFVGRFAQLLPSESRLRWMPISPLDWKSTELHGECFVSLQSLDKDWEYAT